MSAMEMQDPKIEERGDKATLGSKWKSAFIMLFLTTLILECANLTLTSKCETPSDARSALNTFLSLAADQSYPLDELLFRLEQDNTSDLATAASTITPTDESSSLCNPQREFVLEMSDKRINVCTYQGQVRVDIRQFLNNRATMKGIFFNPREFISLREILPSVLDELEIQLRHGGI